MKRSGKLGNSTRKSDGNGGRIGGEFDEHLKDNTKQSKKEKIHDGDDDIDNKEDELDNVTKEAGKVKESRNRNGGDS